MVEVEGLGDGHVWVDGERWPNPVPPSADYLVLDDPSVRRGSVVEFEAAR